MLNDDTQAILLLTAHFAKRAGTVIEPLGNAEWGRFAWWLRDKKLRPGALLREGSDDLLANWTDPKITADRIHALLDRGSALAVAVDKWTGAGLDILTRGDASYPERLKNRLGNQAPPFLFACGNLKLLSQGGIGVVGGRHAANEDLQFSQGLGAKIAQSGHSVVSGGAGGVDSHAMQGALDVEGTVVGVLFKDMLRAMSSSRYRKHLRNGNLALVCAVNPEAGFNAGNAMQRNKYIYCLSEATVVVQSGTRGGTWTGARENLKHNWVPIWVRSSQDPQSGNEQLIRAGAHRLSAQLSDVAVDRLFVPVDETPTHDTIPTEPHAVRDAAVPDATDDAEPVRVADPEASPTETAAEWTLPAAFTLYQHFLRQMAMTARRPMDKKALEDATGLCTTQLDQWLKQAVEEHHMTKLTRPVRYQWLGEEKASQGSLFEDA